MGTKRSNFSLVPMGGKLVAAGGYDGRGVTDVVEVGTNQGWNSDFGPG